MDFPDQLTLAEMSSEILHSCIVKWLISCGTAGSINGEAGATLLVLYQNSTVPRI